MKNEIIHKIKGYLGYEVLLSFSEEMLYFNKKITLEELMDNLRFCLIIECMQKGDIKLILRPVEDLTDEEYKNIVGWESNLRDLTKEELIYTIKYAEITDEFSFGLIKYFQERHLDYQDLIGQGLAIKKEVEND